MALDYVLDARIDCHLEDVLDYVSQRTGRAWTRDGDLYTLEAPGCHLFILKPSALGQSVIQDEFQFTPTISIVFRIDPEDKKRGYDTAFSLAFGFIDQCPGDAVFLFNGEIVVFVKLHGSLSINERYGRSSAEQCYIEMLETPFQIKPFNTI